MRSPAARARVSVSGHLVFVLLMLVFTLWYLFDALRASTAVTNLILILPVSIVLTGLCVAMVVREVRRIVLASGTPSGTVASTGDTSDRLAKWTYAASMVVFIFLIREIGIELSAFLFMVANMRLLGAKSWVFTVIYSAAFSLVLSYLFVSVMNQTLPSLLFGHL